MFWPCRGGLTGDLFFCHLIGSRPLRTTSRGTKSNRSPEGSNSGSRGRDASSDENQDGVFVSVAPRLNFSWSQAGQQPIRALRFLRVKVCTTSCEGLNVDSTCSDLQLHRTSAASLKRAHLVARLVSRNDLIWATGGTPNMETRFPATNRLWFQQIRLEHDDLKRLIDRLARSLIGDLLLTSFQRLEYH